MKIFIRIVPMALVMGTIFFLSHQSGDSLHLPPFPGVDKVAHLLAYGVLAGTVLWYQGRRGLGKPGWAAFLTVLFCLLYGLSDEFHQSFIPSRSVSGLDILADTAGALLVSIIWLKCVSLRRLQEEWAGKWGG